MIINADCLDYMKSSIATDSVDLIITDPPYNIGKTYDGHDDDMPEEDYWKWMSDLWGEALRVLKPSRHLIITCAQKQIDDMKMAVLEDRPVRFRHLAVWHNPNRKAGSYPGQWPFAWEAVLDFTKGSRFDKLRNRNGVGGTDLWIERPPKVIGHPTPKPVGMWTDLIRLTTNPGELVLDPFLGSGTTGLVCERLGRGWMGIEISPRYVTLAHERIDADHHSDPGGVQSLTQPSLLERDGGVLQRPSTSALGPPQPAGQETLRSR